MQRATPRSFWVQLTPKHHAHHSDHAKHEADERDGQPFRSRHHGGSRDERLHHAPNQENHECRVNEACCNLLQRRRLVRLSKSEMELLHLRRRGSNHRSERCEQPSCGPRLMLRHHSAPRVPRSPRASATFRSAPQRTPRCCSGRILSRMSGSRVATGTHSSSQRNRQATVLKHLRPKNQRPLLLDDASGVSLTH